MKAIYTIPTTESYQITGMQTICDPSFVGSKPGGGADPWTDGRAPQRIITKGIPGL